MRLIDDDCRSARLRKEAGTRASIAGSVLDLCEHSPPMFAALLQTVVEAWESTRNPMYASLRNMIPLVAADRNMSVLS